MSRNKIFFLILFIVLGVIFVLPVFGNQDHSIPSPDEVINKYWELHQQGKIEECRALLAGDSVKMLKSDESRPIIIKIGNRVEEVGCFDKIFLDNVEIEAVGYEEIVDKKRFALFGTKVAVADVVVTKPDFEMAFDRFLGEGMEELSLMNNNGASSQEIKEKAEEILMILLAESEEITHREQVVLRLIDVRSAGGDRDGWKIYNWNFDSINDRIEKINKRMNDEIAGL